MSATITLTRDEAYAISCGVRYTSGAGVTGNFSEREDCYEALHDLRLEATIRDAGDWWGEGDPAMLSTRELLDQGACPERFRIGVEGLAPILELLPGLLAYAEETLEHCRVDRARCESGPTPAGGSCHEEYAEYCVIWERCRDALLGLAARLGVEIPQPVTACTPS